MNAIDRCAVQGETFRSEYPPLHAPGVVLVPDDARRIWAEMASGRWRVVRAEDVNGERWGLLERVEAQRLDFNQLGARERRVLDRIAAGAMDKVAAADLALPPAAVSRALHAARKRFGLPSVAHLLRAYRATKYERI